MKKNKDRTRASPNKIEAPILNYVDCEEKTLEKKETFLEKIKKILKKQK